MSFLNYIATIYFSTIDDLSRSYNKMCNLLPKYPRAIVQVCTFLLGVSLVFTYYFQIVLFNLTMAIFYCVYPLFRKDRF